MYLIQFGHCFPLNYEQQDILNATENMTKVIYYFFMSLTDTTDDFELNECLLTKLDVSQYLVEFCSD